MNANDFYKELQDNGTELFCGVPDSLLKEFCACIMLNSSEQNNIITANEGNALAIAAGHYLAKGKPAVVYMQNSGLGNIVNPLLSLNDEDVYSIPSLLIIGWRGEPNIHDEPQHKKQGKLTLSLLETMGIKYEVLENTKQVKVAYEYMKTTNKPFAFIVRKGTFEKYIGDSFKNEYTLSRESAIKQVLSCLDKQDIVVSTTGMISREVYANRQSHEKDFLTVGSMGHASSIAFGVALACANKNVFCFDGDGAFLMHMGSAGVIASRNLTNFKHIIFNNEAHDSVGAQPTIAGKINIPKIASACGYIKTFSVKTTEELSVIWDDFYKSRETCLLEIKVKCGARKELGRPLEKPIENKDVFMRNLRG